MYYVIKEQEFMRQSLKKSILCFQTKCVIFFKRHPKESKFPLLFAKLEYRIPVDSAGVGC